MRFMILIKASKESEAGIQPTKEQFEAMAKYNEQLVKAGVMVAGEGLLSSSNGARVKFSGDKRTVIDGPFTETKELVAGFWILQVKSKEEAIEWVKRIPFGPGTPYEDQGEPEIEIRQIAELADFQAITPELEKRFEDLRAKTEAPRS